MVRLSVGRLGPFKNNWFSTFFIYIDNQHVNTQREHSERLTRVSLSLSIFEKRSILFPAFSDRNFPHEFTEEPRLLYLVLRFIEFILAGAKLVTQVSEGIKVSQILIRAKTFLYLIYFFPLYSFSCYTFCDF